MFDRQEVEKLLGTLFVESLELLITRIKDGSASPADVNNALRVCRENGISMTVSKGESPQFLSEPLPFSADHDLH